MIYARVEFEVFDPAQRETIISIIRYIIESGAVKRGVRIRNTAKSETVNRPLSYYERLLDQIEVGGSWPENKRILDSVYFLHEEDICYAMLAWKAEQLRWLY